MIILQFVGGGVFLGLAQWATYDTTRDGSATVGDVEAGSIQGGGSFMPMPMSAAGGGGTKSR